MINPMIKLLKEWNKGWEPISHIMIMQLRQKKLGENKFKCKDQDEGNNLPGKHQDEMHLWNRTHY